MLGCLPYVYAQPDFYTSCHTKAQVRRGRPEHLQALPDLRQLDVGRARAVWQPPPPPPSASASSSPGAENGRGALSIEARAGHAVYPCAWLCFWFSYFEINGMYIQLHVSAAAAARRMDRSKPGKWRCPWCCCAYGTGIQEHDSDDISLFPLPYNIALTRAQNTTEDRALH